MKGPRIQRRIAVPVIVAICWCLAADSKAADAGDVGAPRPSVLMIVVDDLRAELGCYGQSHILSPHIDALARGGRRFERAYCQQAVCNPSRTSLMPGLRPDAIGVTGNHAYFRSLPPEVVTLSQHFKPVLVGLDRNPLLRIRVDTEGTLHAISLKSVEAINNNTATWNRYEYDRESATLMRR